MNHNVPAQLARDLHLLHPHYVENALKNNGIKNVEVKRAALTHLDTTLPEPIVTYFCSLVISETKRTLNFVDCTFDEAGNLLKGTIRED